jgi:hypothetical protein
VILDEVWRLRRLRSHAEKDFRKEIRTAKNALDRQRTESEMQFELETLDDDLRVALTRKLEVAVRNLDIPIPSGSESWGQHRTSGEGFLKDTVRDTLRLQIGKEGKERRDFWKDILLHCCPV